MQLIYSPEPRFSRNLPVDLFIKGILPQTNIKTVREDSPVFFKEHEIGGKLAASFWGLDASLFHFSYLDRDPTYSLRSMTQTSIELEEAHTRVKTTGLSVAALFYDDFVFRTDIVYTKDKAINSVQGFNLVNSPIDMTNIVMSLDTPTYNNFSGVFVMANSRLSKDLPQAFRQQSQSYSVAKIAYDLGLEKTIDLSYSREWNKKGHALQSLFFWPLNASTEIRVGAETYWGEESGQFNKIRNISSVFVGIKNYFQL